MTPETITIRKSPAVVNHFNIYLEKGENRTCLKRSLTEMEAVAHGTKLAQKLKIKLEAHWYAAPLTHKGRH